jgi:NAD(P)-dependent dehydrogenase (short-subunit alcohol dehydrogenase family)
MENVTGKVAFITGGASGIGFGMAQAFGRAGMKIIIADIEAGALKTANAGLKDDGIDSNTVCVDVSDRQAMAGAAKQAIEFHGAVHVLCNNAGVHIPSPLDQVTYKDWDWIMGVNLWGVINGLMAFLPELKKHGKDAHIVSTASVGGLLGMPNIGIYNTTKFAVVGMMEALRADMMDTGLGVSVLCPGLVKSNLSAATRNRPKEFVPDGADNELDHTPGIMEQGVEPLVIGENVLDAIKADEFFICTHPEFKPLVEERGKALLAAFKSDPSPEQAAAMRNMVRPW